MSWFEQVHAAGVRTVARALELRVAGAAIGPCPKCMATSRSTHDGRGPVGITPDGRGWRCWVCKAGGDAVALSALVIEGTAKPEPSGWARVQRRLQDLGICTDVRDEGARPRVRLSHEGEPSRLPAVDVERFWNACVSVRQDPEVMAWLRGRPRVIDPTLVAHEDLARALPREARHPEWAVYRGQPWTLAHRLVLPMFDERGSMASVHARSVAAGGARDKAANPRGAEVRGLVMADDGAQLLLRESFLDGELWIVEGVPDFLDLTLDRNAGPVGAVIGVINGSWKADSPLGSRVPRGARVVVATHRDDDGERYASWIEASLRGRATLRRWIPFAGDRPEAKYDINLIGRRGGRLVTFGRIAA